MRIAGFDWDEGNWPKCARHGLSKASIEFALSRDFEVFDDPHDASVEKRFRAIGRDAGGRHIFAVFCFRRIGGHVFIRPISARYMHEKEVRHYERQRKK